MHRVFGRAHVEERMLPRMVRLADYVVAAALVERALATLEHLAAALDAGVVDAAVVQQVCLRAISIERK